MPKKLSLEQVQKLATELAPEDRLQLCSRLAALPDSGLIYHLPVTQPTSTVLPSDETQEVLIMNVQMGWKIEEDGTHVYSYEGRDVLSIKFDPVNYAESGFQLLKDKALQLTLSDNGRERLRASLEEYSQRSGISPNEAQYQTMEEEALREFSRQLLRASLDELAGNIDAHLHDVTFAILGKILQASGGSVANLLRDTLKVPQTKIKSSDIQSLIYKAEWDRLKTIVGLQSTHGGPRNVKHDWTPDELHRLAENYKELSPIWREAKRIARAAQKSQESSRRNNWRAEVLRAYPDLPSDLLERFQHLRADDAKPSDIP